MPSARTAAGIILIFTIAWAMLSAAACSLVRAHEWYPPDCCSGHDCAPISDARVVHNNDWSYTVDGKWTFARGDVKLSQSGRYHACFPGGDTGEKPRCFFAPSDSF